MLNASMQKTMKKLKIYEHFVSQNFHLKSIGLNQFIPPNKYKGPGFKAILVKSFLFPYQLTYFSTSQP
jgi:hypothetical protein